MALRILVDIGHPAHVHLFKNFAREMLKKNHKILFTCRDKEVVIHLLDYYKFPFVSFGKPYEGLIGKIKGLVKFDLLMLCAAIRFKPNLFLSHGSFYAAHVATLMRKPHISLEDTGNMEQIRLYKPFTKIILSPSCFHKNLGKKQLMFNSYHELAYLSPLWYTPGSEIFRILVLQPGERYVILRFISWKASHDSGHSGLPNEYRSLLVAELSKYVRVFISSEKELEPEYEPYKIKIPPERMHDALYNAELFVGESLTMVSECAMLGTPAIHVNTMTAGTLAEQEQFGLIFRYSQPEGVLEKAIELLNTKEIKKTWNKRKNDMLDAKIDLTRFLIWLIENYPKSTSILKENPEYQKQFKFVKN